MVLQLIVLLCQFQAYGASFKVDTLGNKDIIIKVPDGATKIMKTHNNPAVLIIDVASIYVNSLKKKFTIQYNSGGSEDPTFNIKWLDGKTEKEFSIEGTELDFHSSGEILISGHTNNKFSQKRKVVFKNNKLSEVEQPYYYVGIKSKSLIDIDARLSPDEKSTTTFHLKKGEYVEVLLSDTSQLYFLLKNKEGLLGWVLISENQRPTVIKEIFFKGD